MSDAFSRLLKVLTLERKQGFRNKAVIGGLDKFASRWETDARAEAQNAAAVNQIVSLLLGYPAVEDTAARARILEQIVRLVGEAAPPGSIGPDVAAEDFGVQETLAGVETLAGAASPAYGTPAGEQAALDVMAPPGGTEENRVTAGAPLEKAPAETVPEAAAGTPMAGKPAPHQPVEVARPGARSELDVQEAPDAGKEQPAASGQAVPPLSKPASPTLSEAGSTRSIPAPSKPELFAVELITQRRPEGVSTSTQPGATELRPASREPVQVTRFEGSGIGLNAPVTRLPSVGPSLAQKLAKLGVHTVHDLLYLLPHRYDDYSLLRTIDKLRYGEEVTIICTIWSIKSRIIGDNRKIITAVVGDGTGEMEMTWFNPFVERRLRIGRAYTFSGRIDSYRGRMLMRNPEFEPLEKQQLHTGRLVPIYPLTEGITARWLRRIMKNAIDAWATDMQDFLPEDVRQEAHLLSLSEALRQIHFPDNRERLDAAHRRLSFDEFLLLQLGVLGHRKRFREFPARPLRADDEVFVPFLSSLPFDLTIAQRRALRDIAADLERDQPMSRLLQGDVGSGKTAIAAAALWAAVANGTQGAIMAPTEILAEQHARSFGAMFAGLANPMTGRPMQVALLTGNMRRAEREAMLAALAAAKIDIAVGTHALIQEDVTFKELAVAVVDEQHRFGVEQRAALRQKGVQPHVLVMSATPIPRSLALTIYGDLDISVIDELPAGRIPVKTKWLTSAQRERAYTFIRHQVESGHQAFIIYPLVEETGPSIEGSDQAQSQVKAAVEEHTRLRDIIFSDLRVGLLHGRMKNEEKDAVMRAFSVGELDILVATSVVEVGIDIPNATVIMIEGAERFGLAQLHQFRGRVGRGGHASYCLLISDVSEGESKQRLQALENSTDGFALAQIDLDMRGPGDFFGTRQSGLPPLRTARLGDLRTLETARAAAQGIFAADPHLSFPEHGALAAQVAAFWTGTGDMS